MQIDRDSAAVDNDFINHIVEAHLPGERIADIFATVFADLNLTAIIHPLVYANEVMERDKQCELFTRPIIHQIDFNDIFQSDSERKAYYLYLIPQFYAYLRGECLPVKDDAILKYWHRTESLGEIHSIAMCLVTGCGIFLSDDGDSRTLRNYAKSKFMSSITIYNRQEFFDFHREQGTQVIPRPERKSLTHVIDPHNLRHKK